MIPGAVDIQIWNKAGTRLLSTLTANGPSNLRYANDEMTKNRQGDATFTFDLKRDPVSDFWEDLEDSNVVKVFDGDDFCWEGDIEGVERKIEADSLFAVECLGWPAKLKIQGTDADVSSNLGVEKGSTYITDHIVGEGDPVLTAGDIDTDDFLFSTGVEFYPGKDFWYILDEICKYQLYDWWIERSLDPRLPPAPRLCFGPRETAVSYQVLLGDCDESTLNRNREDLWNWIQYGYTPDGSLYAYVTSQNAASQSAHGLRMKWDSVSYAISQTEAQALADTFIALHKDLKPNSSISTDIVRDTRKLLVPRGQIEPRKVLLIPDLLPTEETIVSAQGINEMQTWPINEVKMKGGKVSLAPGGLPTTLDVMLAKYDIRSRYM
jgi:hypothetical protein